jgi:urease accessory protein
MLKAAEIIPQLLAGGAVSDTLTLPFELRQKSRLVATLGSGRQIALQLPRGHVLRHGSLLRASDGSIVEVRSADEELSVVKSDDPTELLRAAYHLGNRHVALQIEPDALSYLHDHVLDDMLRGLGLEPSFAERAFEPESGAYGRYGAHSHADHDHGPAGHDPHDHEH